MTTRGTVAAVAVLLALSFGASACRGQTAQPAPSSQGASQELNDIKTTLDAIDSEMAGDGSG
ncbi:MAG TPA: hypothetical protein VJT49_00525 [Amycolatopsis sp.]|uniref:hypothetical protein n=1 Tax=Amycolatopsis sp. TaxID=37632 RepID=UPI002B47E0F6|nr:hypothetical protein [Amycolatopsis sp.]HKS43599.1 hypothetical protein [Amycolatopsis sp.]